MTDETKQKESPIDHLDDNEFYRYFAQKANDNEDFEIKCYRVTRKGNKTYKTWLKDFIDECPTEQELADEYGGGRYWLVAWDSKNKKLEKTIWIDELWTRKLMDRQRVDPGPPKSIDEVRPDPMQYITKMIELLKPVLSMAGNGNNMQPNQMLDMMPKLMEGMTTSMIGSLGRMQTALINKSIKNLNEPAATPSQEPDTTSDKMSMIKEILELAKEFGGSLLNANGMKGKIMQNFIKSDERFSQITEDPQLYDALYTEAVNDPEIGKSKADALFKKLGFDIGQAEGANNT